MPNPIDAQRQKKIKDFLKSHGHNTTTVDKEKITTQKELRKSICGLHMVTEQEWIMAGGTSWDQE